MPNITKGNSGSVTIGNQTECLISSWSATIQSENEEVSTMCAAASANPVILETNRFVDFSIESYVYFGDVVTGNVVLTNDVLSLSGMATMESIEISTPADGIITFSYNGRINDYTVS